MHWNSKTDFGLKLSAKSVQKLRPYLMCADTVRVATGVNPLALMASWRHKMATGETWFSADAWFIISCRENQPYALITRLDRGNASIYQALYNLDHVKEIISGHFCSAGYHVSRLQARLFQWLMTRDAVRIGCRSIMVHPSDYQSERGEMFLFNSDHRSGTKKKLSIMQPNHAKSRVYCGSCWVHISFFFYYFSGNGQRDNIAWSKCGRRPMTTVTVIVCKRFITRCVPTAARW